MRSAATFVMVIILGTGVCHAQKFGGPRDASLRLEWQVRQASGGHSTITGIIFNDDDFWAMTAIQLLVEGLDSLGQPVSKTIGYVDDHVSPRESAYFEVPVRITGTTYRVTVQSVDWFVGQLTAP
ncbi:MAG: hypothetical protein ACE5MM_07810 [Nitrospiraceae bacterium]